jgi:hypothetical protein
MDVALVDLAVRGRVRSRKGEGEEVNPAAHQHGDVEPKTLLAMGELATLPAPDAGDAGSIPVVPAVTVV